MERLNYENYNEFASMVEKESKNKKTNVDFNSWILRLSNNLNGTYHPNDLMKLFVLAIDVNIIFPEKHKEKLRIKAMDYLRNWVIKQPILNREFTRICMKYIVKTELGKIDIKVVYDLVEILDIMRAHKEDKEWLMMIGLRFGHLELKEETISLIIKRIIDEDTGVFDEAAKFKLRLKFTDILVAISESTNDKNMVVGDIINQSPDTEKQKIRDIIRIKRDIRKRRDKCISLNNDNNKRTI